MFLGLKNAQDSYLQVLKILKLSRKYSKRYLKKTLGGAKMTPPSSASVKEQISNTIFF